MYDIENYYQAESVKDAVRLLNEHPDARPKMWKTL